MITFDRPPDWHVVSVPCTTCQSGALVAVAPQYANRARCGPCIVAGTEPTGALVEVPVRRSPGSTGTSVPPPRRPAPVETGPVEYPAPEHTSSDPWPVGYSAPRAVMAMRALAESHGWSVAMTYSRGRHPHGITGRPGALAHWVALRMFHSETGARCVAVYQDGSARKWAALLVGSPIVPVYAGCDLSDVKEWITVAGRVLPSWLDGVRHRQRIKDITAKVWEAFALRGETVGSIARAHDLDKAHVMKIISDCRAENRSIPLKKASSGRKESAR